MLYKLSQLGFYYRNIYYGVLPPDVETTLTLNADGTYLLIQTFKEK